MMFLQKLRDLFRLPYIIDCKVNAEDSYLQKRLNEIERRIVVERLMESARTSAESGVTQEHICDKEVVVSLTSYGKRIHEVYLAIESIMHGTMLPNRIILWLAEEEKDKTLPIVLERQKERGLEIRYCKDIRSYTKLIPSLRLCPEACIITIDDDLIYAPDLVEHLVNSYKESPDVVSACRTHQMTFSEGGGLQSYNSWNWHRSIDSPSHQNFLTGCGGVLYPPHVFPDEVFNEDVFLQICKYADDVWFDAMLILNGVKVKKAFTHAKNGEDYMDNISENEPTLFSVNIQRNDEQIKAVFEMYDIYKKLR